MKKIFLLLTVMISFMLSVTWAGDRYPLLNQQQTDQFNQLIQQFRCLVCQNEDLASSNAALAEDLRQQVYQMVRAGQSDAAITRYMVNRYGDFILFKPPLQRTTIFIWVLPFLLLIVGMIIFYRVTKKYAQHKDVIL